MIAAAAADSQPSHWRLRSAAGRMDVPPPAGSVFHLAEFLSRVCSRLSSVSYYFVIDLCRLSRGGLKKVAHFRAVVV